MGGIVISREEQSDQPRLFSIILADELYFHYRERYASSSYAYKYLLTVLQENLDSVIDISAMKKSLDGFADRHCVPRPDAQKSNVS